MIPAWLLQNDYIKKAEIEALIHSGGTNGVSQSDMESFVLNSLFNLNATLSITGNVTPEWLRQNDYLKSHEITPIVDQMVCQEVNKEKKQNSRSGELSIIYRVS